MLLSQIEKKKGKEKTRSMNFVCMNSEEFYSTAANK